jgi:glycosyltransferase involved in cell wall biosynthesis
MRSFVFFGRLVPEKGFELLFPFFEEVLGSESARIAVFGDGFLRKVFFARFSHRKGFFDFRKLPDSECEREFAVLPPGSIAYFGRRPFSSIAGTLAVSDISLMPSIFLETFGLSALESLSFGVPVAGFSKGGISPFLISDELRLSPRSPTGSLVSLLSVSDGLVSEWKTKALSVSRGYSRERFRERLLSTLPKNARKILLVTDFLSNLGGIETYVANLETALREFGFEVRAAECGSKFSSRLERAASTALSFLNFPARKRLSRTVSDFNPDVVWCHSVLRGYGPVGLDGVFVRDAFRMMTYHDLGYFAPFAAKCFEESDVPPPGFFSFVRSAQGLLGKIFATAKYLKLRMLFSRLSKFDLHLVPSDFVAPYVSAMLPQARTVVLPHYVSFP